MPVRRVRPRAKIDTAAIAITNIDFRDPAGNSLEMGAPTIWSQERAAQRGENSPVITQSKVEPWSVSLDNALGDRDSVWRRSRNSLWVRIKNFQGAHRGGTAGFHTELFEDLLDVLFDGGFGDAQNRRDIGISFSLGHPEQSLGGARRQTQVDQWFWR